MRSSQSRMTGSFRLHFFSFVDGGTRTADLGSYFFLSYSDGLFERIFHGLIFFFLAKGIFTMVRFERLILGGRSSQSTIRATTIATMSLQVPNLLSFKKTCYLELSEGIIYH